MTLENIQGQYAPRAFWHYKRARREDCTDDTLDEQWYPPCEVGVDERAEIIDPLNRVVLVRTLHTVAPLMTYHGGGVAEDVASELHASKRPALRTGQSALIVALLHISSTYMVGWRYLTLVYGHDGATT